MDQEYLVFWSNRNKLIPRRGSLRVTNICVVSLAYGYCVVLTYYYRCADSIGIGFDIGYRKY